MTCWDGVQNVVGAAVGVNEGIKLGLREGSMVGESVGLFVGVLVGSGDGDMDGWVDMLGSELGPVVPVGAIVNDGDSVGFEVGAKGAVNVIDRESVKTAPLATTAPLKTKAKYPSPYSQHSPSLAES